MSRRVVLPEFDGRIMDGLLFSRKVYQRFNAIRLGPNGHSEILRRDDPEVKALVGELLPLAAFLQRRYSAAHPNFERVR